MSDFVPGMESPVECLFCGLMAPRVCEKKEDAKKCSEFKQYFEEKTR